jgi:hypothetical protein
VSRPRVEPRTSQVRFHSIAAASARLLPHVMKLEGSLQCSELTAIGFCPEPAASRPHPHINFNIEEYNPLGRDAV